MYNKVPDDQQGIIGNDFCNYQNPAFPASAGLNTYLFPAFPAKTEKKPVFPAFPAFPAFAAIVFFGQFQQNNKSFLKYFQTCPLWAQKRENRENTEVGIIEDVLYYYYDTLNKQIT